MKKNTTVKKTQSRVERIRTKKIAAKHEVTIGIDLGDTNSEYCVLDEAGEVSVRNNLPTTKAGMTSHFGKLAPCLIVIEAGTHSAWVSRLLTSFGHEVIVANPRRVKLITQSKRKNDRIDAEMLARLGRADRSLLSPIQHRGEEAQQDLAVIRVRAELVGLRTSAVNCARGLVKSMGERLKKCDADQVKESLAEGLSEGLKEVIQPLLKCVEGINEQVRRCDKKIEGIAKRYPEVELLTPVYGVGKLIGLTFVLTLEDAHRFERSRDVGAYVGLTPGQKDSGKSQPQMRISKSGDKLLRTLLVQGAQCVLRKGAADSDLREWGLKKQKDGGKRGKRRAVIGVARRLAVLLHHLWVSGEVYDPLYNRKQAEQAKGKQKAA